jgi:hypothetical protein
MDGDRDLVHESMKLLESICYVGHPILFPIPER